MVMTVTAATATAAPRLGSSRERSAPVAKAPAVESAAVVAGLRRQMAEISRNHALKPPGMAVPQGWEELFRHGEFPCGSVARFEGSWAGIAGMVAAVTASGRSAAVIGMPTFNLAGVQALGGDWQRLFVIPDGQGRPVDIAAIACEAIDLVVVQLHGTRVPLTRGRAVAARLRQQGSSVIALGGSWVDADLSLSVTPHGWTGMETPVSPLREVSYEVTVETRKRGGRSTTWSLGAAQITGEEAGGGRSGGSVRLRAVS